MSNHRIKMIHKECGAQVAWWLGGIIKPCDILRSSEYERMDGTHPKHGSVFKEYCPTCKKSFGMNDTERVHE